MNNPLDISNSSTGSNSTTETEIKNDTGNPIAVSVSTSGLPTGAATEAKQDVGNTSLGTIATNIGTTGSSAKQIQGNVAAGSADSGNPVKIGGVYNSSPPTFTTGQRADFQTDSQGRQKVTIPPLSNTTDSITTYGTVAEQASLSAGSLNADLVPSTDVSLYRWASLQITGTWSGTISFQGSNDNSNFNSVSVNNLGSAVSLVQTTTSNNIFAIPISYKYLRIRMTSYSSGTANGTLELYTVPNQMLLAAMSAAQNGTWTVQPGNTANTTPWLVTDTLAAAGGALYAHIAAGQATTTVKSGAGNLYAIVFNSAATATNVTTVYDNTAGSGTVIAIPTATAVTNPITLSFGRGMAFSTGLTIVTSTANGSDMTVVYK